MYWCTTISITWPILCVIKCIDLECNKFVLVLVQVELMWTILYKINFRATTKKMTQPHNCIVHQVRTIRNTKTYIPPEPKKLTQHHNSMVLQVHSSMYNQNLFPASTKYWHNSTTGKKVPPAHEKREQVPPAHAKRVYLFLCPSVRKG